MKPGSLASDFSWGRVSLLPSAPYSSRDESRACVLGLAFERQQGVHAVGGGRRQDFDAWPGELAFTPSDVEMFSESGTGGEYLVLQVQHVASNRVSETTLIAPRAVFRGDRQAVLLGNQLRRSMLAAHPLPQRIEEQAMRLLNRGLSLLAHPHAPHGIYAHDRQVHARVLEYIDDELDGSLGLDDLAQMAGMPVLRFLRSFSSAIGSTPHAYITERRMQRARSLLSETDRSIADIAADCGFAHQSHLGGVLKERLGLSPGQYRTLAGRT